MNKIFRDTIGFAFVNYNIKIGLCEFAFNWCNVNIKADKYMTLKAWEKACDIDDIDTEAIHNFLKQFIPKELRDLYEEN